MKTEGSPKKRGRAKGSIAKSYTVEEARIVTDLKENQNKSWRYVPVPRKKPNVSEIGEIVGRSGASLAVSYSRIRALLETFSNDEVSSVSVLKITKGPKTAGGH